MASSENEKLLQRDAQKSGALDSVLAETMEHRLRDLHTSLPGIVQSYNPELQTVEVQPSIQRVFTELGAINLPLCVDVPVVFPGAGGFFLTHPIEAGDECLIVFGERCIDDWFFNSEVLPPAEYRIHDMSDGFAIFAPRSLPKVIVDVQTDGIELRNLDRSSFAKVADDLIELNLNEGATLVKLEPGLITMVGDIEHTGKINSSGSHTASEHTAGDINLTTHIHLIIVPSPGAPVTPPVV